MVLRYTRSVKFEESLRLYSLIVQLCTNELLAKTVFLFPFSCSFFCRTVTDLVKMTTRIFSLAFLLSTFQVSRYTAVNNLVADFDVVFVCISRLTACLEGFIEALNNCWKIGQTYTFSIIIGKMERAQYRFQIRKGISSYCFYTSYASLAPPVPDLYENI